MCEVKVDLDTRENKQRLRGEYGYTQYIKRHNYKWTFIMLVFCLAVFSVGKTLFYEIEPLFMVVSALLILPFAQYLAKAISFSRYKPLEEEQFILLEKLSPQFLVLGELPIIRGKTTYFCEAIVITCVGVFILIPPKKNTKDTKQIIESIIRPKGHHEPVKIYNDFDSLYKQLKTNVKSQAQKMDSEKMERIAEALIIKAH